MSRYLTLVTGGARSGKSNWAEARFASEPIRYVATGYPTADDAEWSARVAVHQARRPKTWDTVETTDLVGVLGTGDGRPVLIDCLSLWLARTMDAADAWQRNADIGPDRAALLVALAQTDAEVVLVTNEVGSGIVPNDPGTRRYRDELGRLNASIAEICHEVVLTVAGIAIPIKGSPPPWRLATQ